MNKLLLCTRIRLQLLVACVFSLLFFLVSCSDDAETFSTATFESQEMSDEILEKIAYGCDSYFDQELSGRKNETSASDEYIALLEQRLSQFVANKSITASDNNMVGVIKSDKVKGCGKYKEVEVYYDCQDHSANNTEAKGYHGLWTVTLNRDLGQYKTRVSNVNLYDVIHQDRNTRFYMSKIKF